MFNTAKHKILFAYIFLIFAAIVWGSTYVVIKDLLNDIQPISQLVYRMTLATILLFLFVRFKKLNPFKNLYVGLNLGLSLWVVYVPQTLGLVYTSASNAGFIASMYVVLVPIISFLFLNTNIHKRQVLAVLTATFGLWLLTGHSTGFKQGDILIFISALGIAVHILMADYYLKKKFNPYVLCFQQILFLTVFSFITALLLNQSFSVKNNDVIGAIVYLAIFPSFAAYLIQTVAQKYITPVNISLIGIIEPIVGALLAWTIGKEIIDVTQAVGGLIIVSSIFIAVTKTKKLHIHLKSL
jgi:drug/metabolite transporter (DMT)-like permease